jgi:hypothetical protein
MRNRKLYSWTLLLSALLLLAGCKSKSSSEKQAGKVWNRPQAEIDYQFIQAELALADSAKPYLVINQARKQLEIRLKGAIVWNYPFEVADEAEEIGSFIGRFQGEEGKILRTVTDKYLFAATEKNPDSVLAIVSQALGVDQELLQREVPSRFQLRWGSKLVLDVYTNVEAQPKSRLKNTMLQVSQMIKRPFGEAHLGLKMKPEKAVTFWRAAVIGMPTLVYPVE